jgi:hypothetical protein
MVISSLLGNAAVHPLREIEEQSLYQQSGIEQPVFSVVLKGDYAPAPTASRYAGDKVHTSV